MSALFILILISAFISWALIALAIQEANTRNHNAMVEASLKLQNNSVPPFGKLKCKKACIKSKSVVDSNQR
jgi:hypothetical protein